MHDEISKTIGHNHTKMTHDRHEEKQQEPQKQPEVVKPSKSKMSRNKNQSNATGGDDDLESEEEFNEEGTEFMMTTIFGMPGEGFNATHFFEQSKKRAHAIYHSM